MGEIEFVDELPAVKLGEVGPWAAAQLRERPGTWARLSLAAGGASALKRRHAGEFEFTTRTVDKRRVLFGRYIGHEVRAEALAEMYQRDREATS